jgi:MarR family transcriptional regulator, organic hydroperoxide resistance regulator
VILRYADEGVTMARAFFAPLARHSSAALTGLPEADLASAHRVFTALIGAMHTFGRS